MTTEQLDKIWSGLSHSGQSQFEFKRIDGACMPELNIGLSSDLRRCLILEVPRNGSNWPDIEKDNLSLRWYREPGYIVIELLDAGYIDLFNDLILSIYRSISGLAVPGDYITGLIRIFNRWSGFFDERQSARMQPDALRGILGELLFMKDILGEASYETVNTILSSWRGPYDAVRDFITDTLDTEVKTTDGNSDIRISSEFQLEPEPGKRIQLAVVTIEQDLVNGISLRSLVGELRMRIDTLAGDMSLLPDALMQKGLNYRNVHEYDNFRFRVRRITIYDCMLPEFPSLRRSALSPAIFQVSYRLRMNSLRDFIIQIKEL